MKQVIDPRFHLTRCIYLKQDRVELVDLQLSPAITENRWYSPNSLFQVELYRDDSGIFYGVLVASTWANENHLRADYVEFGDITEGLRANTTRLDELVQYNGRILNRDGQRFDSELQSKAKLTIAHEVSHFENKLEKCTIDSIQFTLSIGDFSVTATRNFFGDELFDAKTYFEIKSQSA